jgi:hypothetical protein
MVEATGLGTTRACKSSLKTRITWLAVSILQSDARWKNATKETAMIEMQGALGVPTEEGVEEEEVSPEPEYGWIDERGTGFNDDEDADNTAEEEMHDKQVEDLTDLLLLEKGCHPDPRIGVIMPIGQDLQVWRKNTLQRLAEFKEACKAASGGIQHDAEPNLRHM